VSEQPALPLFGQSRAQDKALSLCLRQYKRCPLNCSQDGAPNCHAFVVDGLCEPGRQAMAALAKPTTD
jgi:hypothetical protein